MRVLFGYDPIPVILKLKSTQY